jgi:hypothetical protein
MSRQYLALEPSGFNHSSQASRQSLSKLFQKLHFSIPSTSRSSEIVLPRNEKICPHQEDANSPIFLAQENMAWSALTMSFNPLRRMVSASSSIS